MKTKTENNLAIAEELSNSSISILEKSTGFIFIIISLIIVFIFYKVVFAYKNPKPDYQQSIEINNGKIVKKSTDINVTLQVDKSVNKILIVLPHTEIKNSYIIDIKKNF